MTGTAAVRKCRSEDAFPAYLGTRRAPCADGRAGPGRLLGRGETVVNMFVVPLSIAEHIPMGMMMEQLSVESPGMQMRIICATSPPPRVYTILRNEV